MLMCFALCQVGCITLDNASNCETMMDDLARLLEARGISFSRDGNRLRCAFFCLPESWF